MAVKAGYPKDIPWTLATQIALCVYLILTIFSMFHRADFLSVTICALGLYVLDNPQNITQKTFRCLLLMTVVSWLYDLTFLFVLNDSNKENKLDGGAEKTVRMFSHICLWLSFIFRIVVILIFWKDSHDFQAILGTPLDLPLK